MHLVDNGPLERVKRDFKKFAQTVFYFSAAINLLMLSPAIYMLQVYDRVLTSNNEITLLMLSAIAILLFVIMGFLDYARHLIVIRLSAHLDASLADEVYGSVYRGRLKHDGPAMEQSLADLAQLRQFLAGSGPFLLLDAPWFPVYVAALYLFSPTLAGATLLGALVLMGFAFLSRLETKAHIAKLSAAFKQSNFVASTTQRGVETIHALGLHQRFLSRWLRLHAKGVAQEQKLHISAAHYNIITKTIRLSLQSGILGLGALLAVRGEISPSMMIAGSILMGRALAPIEQVTAGWKQYGSVKDAWRRLAALLKAYPAPTEVMVMYPPSGHLTVEDVTLLATQLREPLLQRIQFDVRPGEVLAVIGPTGAGKTTLARILVGALVPTSGKVRLDGENISRPRPKNWEHAIGYLPQETEIFPGTIAENIARFGDATPEAIMRAADAAGIHDVILRLPHGYGTVIGPGATHLSGGQKQLICLARAVFGDPKLVILDEPNTNLDDAGRGCLLRVLSQAREKSQAIVVITHDRAALSYAQKTLLLVGGIAQAYGPTEKMMPILSRRAAVAQIPTPHITEAT